MPVGIPLPVLVASQTTRKLVGNTSGGPLLSLKHLLKMTVSVEWKRGTLLLEPLKVPKSGLGPNKAPL